MLKGCQKKIIFLKNTGSDMFDEAYFVLKENAAANEHTPESDMIKEACRIISTNKLLVLDTKPSPKKGMEWSYFLAGALSCGIFIVGLLLLI